MSIDFNNILYDLLPFIDLTHFVAIINTEGDDMETLLLLRKKKGVTQKDVADYLKISRQAYANYESGRRTPDIKMLKLLSIYFETSIDAILSHSVSSTTTHNIKSEETLDEREKTLIKFFRQASEQGKQRIIQSVLNACDNNKK